ncbi:hypothetical protein TVAG_139030 [Trichomonas vaginalis G3]|uniref:Uncharacterized protein n=1 Tax=Trichomonas vaginalis (strain ATCC PRA-98 / G3) TaxID=412133 RepID=A2E477_TRIV3|nr:armadillo (ARM) repeat-containing protein family [Trichomonas vaginalis G3]EAY12523.1 hypothetical protein TVAG_139030 [Trichomonas vaginalis G3]KAI5554060.1 armadillo (ARM) repeat-containing protein family [Trichomonas vaginalis G3]|eukprot:XP_001324746.1 hypothetical protein [Trichomonas vaginalis G3]
MKIIDLEYDNEFMDSLIYNFKQNIDDEETQKSFVQIVLPCFLHGLFTENFASKKLSILAEFSPQNVVASILETIEDIKYKDNIANALIEINDVVAKFNVETEDYYLAVLSLVDEISSVEEELTGFIYQLYAKFTSVFPMDESLTDWINSVFTKSIEISQVSILDKEIKSNMRQTLINVFSNADAEMIWSLLEVFRENMDQILCENIGPFVDAFPITTFIDFCFNDEQKVNYFIIHRLLKNSGLYLDDKIITMIKSSICNTDLSIRNIGASIVKQTLSNICVYFPHYMPMMKKPQINKPSNDKEKIKLIHETVLKTIKQNFNGKDYQYQVSILYNLKILLSFDLDDDLTIEILNYLMNLPILTLHSAVLSRIIECFTVLFECKKKNYYQPNNYEKAKLEIINYQNIHKKVSTQISEMIYNYILEIPINALKQNVVDSVLQLLNCAAQIDITIQSQFSKFVEKFKENNDNQFYRILSVFINNCDINTQFGILDNLIQYVCQSDNDFKDVRDHLISYLDSIDFYSQTYDSNEIIDQRKGLVGKIIDISIEKNNPDTTSFVISCINSLVDGKHPVLTQKLFKFVIENLSNEDKSIRQTSNEIISKATEYLIPRSAPENYEFNDKRLSERKKVSVKMSGEEKNSEEFLKQYFDDDIEERLKISQTMNEFLDNMNHCLELIVSDEENIFSLQNFKIFSTMMRYFNSKFTEFVFEIDEHLLDSKSYDVVSFVNESISAFITTYHYTKDEQNLPKLFNFIQSKPELLFIPSSLVSSKDPKRYEFLTNYIQSIDVDDDILIFNLPFACNDEKFKNFIISTAKSPQILAELSFLDPESIYNQVFNTFPLNFSVYLSSLFNEQSLSTISITKIVISNINQIFGMILDEKTDDEIIENLTNVFKSLSFNIDQSFSFNFQQVDEKWLILISELEIIETLFENAAFYVDEHVSDIILDFIVPSMMMSAPEITGSAQRLLTIAFERFYSLQENADIFVGVFTKMAQEDSVSGLNGLMCIVSGTPLFGTVPQHIADALTVLNDYSSSNHQISEFLNLFWSKYEGTFVPSASLCLSPIRKSLKTNL